MLLGKFREGWAAYEWRLKTEEMKGAFYHDVGREWRGKEDLSGKTIMVSSEQGLGDSIQFCRYFAVLKSLGAEAIFRVPQPLVRVLSSLRWATKIVSSADPPPAYNFHCPLLSLPHIFDASADSIPSETPYLFAEADKVSDWKKRLGKKTALRVGIVWSGSADHKRDAYRSIRFLELSTLLDGKIEWHSLQIEYRSADLELLNRCAFVRQHQDELHDFSDTAALVHNLDLVISVDTSVAHLAAAMHKPTWILLPYVPDCRWLLDRVDSPWYSSMRLFRQDASRDWRSVLECVRNELERL